MGRITATIETTQAVEISPRMQEELRMQLGVWAELRAELARVKAALDEQVDMLDAIREDLGVGSLEFEGHTITRVEGATTNVFDKEEFVRRGGDLMLYNNCHHRKPKKAYTLVTPPKRGKDGAA